MTQVVIGVDVGTTSAKATAFDVDGGEHGHGEQGGRDRTAHAPGGPPHRGAAA